MTFTNVPAAPSSLAGTRADGQPRTEQEPTAPASHRTDPAGRSASRPAGERLPQSQWPAFKPPTCACGHPSGDHGHASAGLHVSHGRCFRCDCVKFNEEK